MKWFWAGLSVLGYTIATYCFIIGNIAGGFGMIALLIITVFVYGVAVGAGRRAEERKHAEDNDWTNNESYNLGYDDGWNARPRKRKT